MSKSFRRTLFFAMIFCVLVQVGVGGLSMEGHFQRSERDIFNTVVEPSTLVFGDRVVSLVELEKAASDRVNLKKEFDAEYHFLPDDSIPGYRGYLELVRATWYSDDQLLLISLIRDKNILFYFDAGASDESWVLNDYEFLEVTSLDLFEMEDIVSRIFQEKRIHSVRLVRDDVFYAYHSFVNESYVRKNHIRKIVSEESEEVVLETLSPVFFENEKVYYIEGDQLVFKGLHNNSRNVVAQFPPVTDSDRYELLERNFLLVFQETPYFFRYLDSLGENDNFKIISTSELAKSIIELSPEEVRSPKHFAVSENELWLHTVENAYDLNFLKVD